MYGIGMPDVPSIAHSGHWVSLISQHPESNPVITSEANDTGARDLPTMARSGYYGWVGFMRLSPKCSNRLLHVRRMAC